MQNDRYTYTKTLLLFSISNYRKPKQSVRKLYNLHNTTQIDNLINRNNRNNGKGNYDKADSLARNGPPTAYNLYTRSP